LVGGIGGPFHEEERRNEEKSITGQERKGGGKGTAPFLVKG